ncbi:MAG: hypothetical protein JNM63_17410, partial [Spirochaetia bacterium]|nr:hypothetical protein [Spirochaetia bacterium]
MFKIVGTRLSLVFGFLALFFPVAQGANKALPPEIASWSEAIKMSQRKAGVKIMTQIREAAAEGALRFVIPPGDYRFDDAAISNHLEFTATNLVIEAGGATFWIEEDITRFAGLRIKQCKNVTLRGLT